MSGYSLFGWCFILQFLLPICLFREWFSECCLLYWSNLLVCSLEMFAGDGDWRQGKPEGNDLKIPQEVLT